ncbi:cleavage stimulation factor subunit 2 [Caerostris extrusa]|uniref:Cleavage stimulation factor subunit 2 n=1 Tax=Caerostris extrusa TaxID=172846 RepID=A0AAV4MR09_CAEEX|nr:cleavage stimulation factor subunit 2 [Caerostris extrusa]
MSAMQGALSAAERSMRSVFVGNIPYEATEEQLKDIFAEVGPVVSFSGYGFCEYKDQEMALSAMRNLNSYELNGRALRVDNAASEKSKEELKNLQASLGGPPVESPYGPEVLPEKAPDAISKVMCSVPPEQLYELMIQMKTCIENNPNEARNLLMQNPQLSYALLQTQVIMKIIDTETAKNLLHSPGFVPPPPELCFLHLKKRLFQILGHYHHLL